MLDWIAWFQTAASVLIGCIATFLASYLLLKKEFKFNRKNEIEQKKMSFYDSLISELPSEKFLSKISGFYNFQETESYMFEKVELFSCLSVRAQIYAEEKVIEKLDELVLLLKESSLSLPKKTGSDEFEMSFTDFIESYQKITTNLIELVKEDLELYRARKEC